MKPISMGAALALVCTAAATDVGAAAARRRADEAPNRPTVDRAVRFDVSKPLRSIAPVPFAAGEPRQVPNRSRNLAKRARPSALARDPLLGASSYAPVPQGAMPDPILTFEGTTDADNELLAGGAIVPSDTNGDVGPNHYVQFNNLVFEVFDKTTGASLFGPLPGNALFSDFGGPCEEKNDGDSLVLYDQLADRWLLSQFAIDDGLQCVAVSTSPDPTGSYYRYAFYVTPGLENDYPKIGVWPDAYYSTYRRFPVEAFASVAAAFEREKMLAGDPGARQVTFVIPAPAGIGCEGDGSCWDGVLPSHLEGKFPPPVGTPNFFVMADDDEANGGSPPDLTRDFYRVWKFHVDWSTPASSTFTGPVSLAVPEMDVNLCGFGPCVPQPATNSRLHTLAYFTMYRLVYRNFGTHEALWVNNTVDVGDERAGIRWAEIRDPGGAPTLHQTGTLGPDDGVHRWMGSLAVDGKGNMALGYSASSADLYPSIRYAGRLASDPPGLLAQTESEMYAGTGSQAASFNRWGDYSSMSVDESDDCTFWFTTEYYETTGAFDFKTRVGSFRFPTCVADATGFITGTVTDATTGNPLAGVEVSSGGFSAITLGTGRYSMEVPVGAYDLRASVYAYQPQTVTGVSVGDGETVTRDFALVPEPTVRLRGTVTDGSGAGWPLRATVRIAPLAGPVQTLTTDLHTGQYEATVFTNSTYVVEVNALDAGYVPQQRTISTGAADQNESFALLVDRVSCHAPGYGFAGATLAAADFESGLPAGWTVTHSTTGCGLFPQWTDTDPAVRGNLTGGSGKFMIADSDNCGESADMATDLLSPVLDLTGVGAGNALQITFNSDYRDLCDRPEDEVSLDVWNGSAWITVLDLCFFNRRGPRLESFVTTAANGVPGARVRWHYAADWDWWWQVDNVTLSASSCQFGGGGRLLGNVYDANTGLPLNGAVVTLDSGGTATTVATPADPAVDDGFFVIYSPPGSRTLTAAFPAYQSQGQALAVTGGAVLRQDFQLAAGRLAAAPLELRRRLAIGAQEVVNLTLRNTGGAAGAFSVTEIDVPAPAPLAARPAAGRKETKRPRRILSDAEVGAPAADVATAAPTAIPDALAAAAAAGAGTLVRSFDTGLPAPWGIGFDTHAGDLWISNIAINGGDDLNYRFTTDGVNTGDTIDTSPFAGAFAADMTFNPRTGMLWQVNARDSLSDSCLYELDPVARMATGRKICADFSGEIDQNPPLRALAYNPITDTYYIGTWFGNFVVEVDPSGRMLRFVQVGVSVSGLAFNPRTGHLFAQTQTSQTVIWVMDVNRNFSLVSVFVLAGENGPAYGPAAGAGLEIDCAGRLWSVNQRTRKLYVHESGETDACVDGIDWLTLAPTSGSVAAAGTFDLAATFTTDGIATGCHEGHLATATDTPYGGIAVPLGITVQFDDVPPTVKGERYIHALAGADISHGCTSGRFCPARPLTRSVAAQWLLRSRFGVTYAPPPAQGLFADISPDSPAAAWAEDLYGRGIIGACSASPLRFCPNRSITKKEMAVLLLKTREGPEYAPPACTGRFTDVPCAAPEAPWIEDAFQRGILEACGRGGRRFCPGKLMTRAQSAEADAKAFGIPACKQ